MLVGVPVAGAAKRVEPEARRAPLATELEPATRAAAPAVAPGVWVGWEQANTHGVGGIEPGCDGGVGPGLEGNWIIPPGPPPPRMGPSSPPPLGLGVWVGAL